MIMRILKPLWQKYFQLAEAWTICVKGRVQGVGFRFSAHRQARLLGLAGWVRNEYDGSVKLFIQGENAQIARFLSWLSQGPALSYVSSVVKVPAVQDERLSSFDIRS